MQPTFDTHVARTKESPASPPLSPPAIPPQDPELNPWQDSPAGAQPMVAERSGAVLVFNGCIYNHVALREELRARGHAFRSTSDTEVI